MIKTTVELTIAVRTEAEGTVPLWFSIPAQETYALNFQPPRELMPFSIPAQQTYSLNFQPSAELMWFSTPAQMSYALNFQPPRELNLIYDSLSAVGIFDYTFDLTFE